ncbi:MAG TPA: tRNA (adenosine(37)-N6)-dimethylallyltransferase MiaA [Syntrophobacteraceae bacterium]|nr:tRNA (adenosine(37)-N6)-dimethylallyltransferase MiaA [Syntrophobacteraceae bacterium]
MEAYAPPPPVVLLAGPTAVGKTTVSLDLAVALGCEIVNADSMQVYRFMDIGTAKPGREERARVPHHLLDVADPDEPFDAARYLRMGQGILSELHGRGVLPLVVGGTGLYMKALTRGLCEGPPSDEGVRAILRREEKEKGLEFLFEELSRVDPAAARRLHPHDRQRILRALEVFRLTGQPLSARQSRHGFSQSPYRTVKVCLHRDRQELYERIDRRVERMMEAGFVEEVRRLLDMGYGPELKPMQSLGYRQIVSFLRGACSLDSAISRIQRDTRSYAKRQLTWFRGDPEFHWFHPRDRQVILEFVRAELRRVPDTAGQR